METEITVDDIRSKLPWRQQYRVIVSDNPSAGSGQAFWHGAEDKWDTWEKIMAAGKSYMVSASMTMAQYVASHRSSVTGWLRLACRWAWENQPKKLVISGKTRCYEICRRGEYVEIGLPHHDAGGERHWVTRGEFKSRILVNVD